jgi:hypothetical protein
MITFSSTSIKQIHPLFFSKFIQNIFPILQKRMVTQIQLPLLSLKIWTINQAIENLMHAVQKGSPQAEYLFVTETIEIKMQHNDESLDLIQEITVSGTYPCR